MKVLIIGVFSPTSSNNSLAKGFEILGAEVIRYRYRTRAKVLRSDLLRDQEIVRIAYEQQVDLTVFCKANMVSVRAVRGCNAVGKTFLWWMDANKITFREQDNIDKMREVTVTGVTTWDVLDAGRKLVDNIEYVDDGFDPERDFVVHDVPYEYDVSFIGALYGWRAQHWQALKFKNITDAYGIDHSRAVARSKINLNFTRSGVIPDNGPSVRIYKIMASRGFLLTETFPYLNDYGFVPGKDFVVFDGIDDLRNKIIYYLDPEHEQERLAIAESGWRTVQKYNRYLLAERMLSLCQLPKPMTTIGDFSMEMVS